MRPYLTMVVSNVHFKTSGWGTDVVRTPGLGCLKKQSGTGHVRSRVRYQRKRMNRRPESKLNDQEVEVKYMSDRKQQRGSDAVSLCGKLDELQQPLQLEVAVYSRICEIGKEHWDACNDGSNPFVCYDFLDSLEESGSVSAATGWVPQHVVLRDVEKKEVHACVPLYLKSHSYGEYVFDHSWAEAYDQASAMTGSSRLYYPKLQSCVPFTPVTGTRLLVKPGPYENDVRIAASQMLASLPNELGVSGIHITFCSNNIDSAPLESAGFMKRIGIQYHWVNQSYESFDDFLSSLQQRKRKSIRQERKRLKGEGLTIRRLSGDDVRNNDYLWDRFYQFYLNTSQKKWGIPYLNRKFFSMLGDRLSDRVLLVVAERKNRCSSEMIAGALNLIGTDAIYGRNWGCEIGENIKGLHFELCFYQAIEEAIERGLPRVEAGAQGEHKLQRGYLPVLTHSMHYIEDEGFKEAIKDFLWREKRHIELIKEQILLNESPYKDIPEVLQ